MNSSLVNVDYSKLEARAMAHNPKWFEEQYFTTYKDDAKYLVKLRYDMTPAADTHIVDWGPSDAHGTTDYRNWYQRARKLEGKPDRPHQPVYHHQNPIRSQEWLLKL